MSTAHILPTRDDELIVQKFQIVSSRKTADPYFAIRWCYLRLLLMKIMFPS
jgi:hypothetical protein